MTAAVFSFIWFIHCIQQWRIDKLYATFYKQYGVIEHAKVLNYDETFSLGRNHILIKLTVEFNDEYDNSYYASICTNNTVARKYKNVKEDDFLCLFDAMKAKGEFLNYLDSRAPSSSCVELRDIPLAILPSDVDFVRNGIIERFYVPIYFYSFLLTIGLMLFVGERFSDSSLNFISEFGYMLITICSVFLVILIILSIRKRLH
jgi:hypothetical protein